MQKLILLTLVLLFSHTASAAQTTVTKDEVIQNSCVDKLQRYYRKNKILLVSNDADLRNDLLARLKKAKLKSVAAEHGLSAVAHAETERFSLALIDLKMPDALETIRTIRVLHRWKKIPILGLVDSKTDRQAYIDAGITDFIDRITAEDFFYCELVKWLPLKRIANTNRTKHPRKAQPRTVRGFDMKKIIGANYEIGAHEVTQGEWRSVMGRNPSYFKSCGSNCPVEQVSWDDVQLFLKKLNKIRKRNYRLPTEIEWEMACYGVKRTTYCGGDDLNSVAWHSGSGNRVNGVNKKDRTHPAGKKQANIYGIHDMTGNVWEWVQDHYDDIHLWRTVRGGSWNDSAQGLRADVRYKYEQSVRARTVGFRLARTLPLPPNPEISPDRPATR